MTTSWLWRAISITPSIMGPSRRNGDDVLTMVKRLASRRERVGIYAAGDAHDLQRVADPRASQGVGVKGLVAQGDEGREAIEVPGLRRQSPPAPPDNRKRSERC